jgi:DNA-directed RNA polymerase subunit RPC12/RpoP
VTKSALSCPSCGAALASEPADAPLSCTRCSWRLISREEWKALSAFSQGYALYMQGSWRTSELKGETNPYAEDSPKWIKFQQGQQRAVLDAQDSEA